MTPARRHRLLARQPARQRQRRDARGAARRPQRPAAERPATARRSTPGSAASPASRPTPIGGELARLRLPQQPPGAARRCAPTASTTRSRARATATARSASACSSAPAPRASWRPRSPIAQRGAQTARCRPGFRYRDTHNMFSLCRLRAARASAWRARPSPSPPPAPRAPRCSPAPRALIEAGLVDAAVVGGVDSLCLTTLYGFNSLELLSQRALPALRRGARRPVDRRGGRLRAARAAAAGRAPLALLGYGESGDAHHMSTPHPEGAGAAPAMRAALERAGARAGADRLRQPARHRHAGNDAAEDARGVRRVRRRACRAARPRAGPGTRSARPASSRR